MSDEITSNENNDVCVLVRKAEKDYTSGVTTISKYVQVSQYDTLNRIEAYVNSKHISGDTDSEGREKPFFNIVTAAINIWFRATDIDRKNIKVKSNKSTTDIAAFFATVWLAKWMRTPISNDGKNYGQYLNRWGRTLAKYGSAVTKFVEQDGKLYIIVVPWSRIICDTIDFYANPVIEKLEMTAGQLRAKKSYNQEMVEKLINAQATARKELSGEQRDNRTEYFTLYEIHGVLPKSYKTGLEADKDDYKQQMHVISFLETEIEGEYDDYTLFSGYEKQSPYVKDDLLEEDEQTLAIGAVQNLFEAQWMVNHNEKNIKDVLDFISKLIYQSADDRFLGQNVLSNLQIGDILIHSDQKPLSLLQSNVDINGHQNFGARWKALGQEINGISEALMGKVPAGSAWRQTQAVLSESHNLFEVMTQNKGLAIEQHMRKFILPFAKKKMNNSDEIRATLDAYHISQIDAMYVPNEAIRRHNKIMDEAVLNGEDVPQFDPATGQAQVQNELNRLGNQRFFKPDEIGKSTWDMIFDDIDNFELEVELTGEQHDIQAAAETIMSALKMYTTATPEQLADPTWRMSFNKMLELSGEISPLEIPSSPPPQPKAPVNKVSESISFKDLPPEGQQQMAAQAGLKIQPPTAQVQPAQVQPVPGR